jgi:DNA-binding transcriptional LysR family regulator
MQLSDRIGRRLKLHDLHVLMTVVQAGSMGKAAARLNTVQPAISRSIAELERVLGVRLLERHRQGVEPTVYGRALLDCGVAVFDDLRQGVKNIEFLTDPTAGEVRIGCNPVLATSFVSTLIERMSQQYPRVAFHLTVSPVERLLTELNERNVDLLITRKHAEHDSLDFESLFDDSFVVMAGSRSPLRRRRTTKLADLVNEPWVLPPPESVLGTVARKAFRASGLDYPHVTVVAIPPEVRINLLASGRFLTIFPTSVLEFSSRRSEIKVLPVKLPATRVTNGIVTVKSRTLSPVARLVIDGARELAKTVRKKKIS